MVFIIVLCDVAILVTLPLHWHLTFSHEAALQSQKNRTNIASDSRRYEWPHGKCSAWQSKVGYESPSVSLTQSLHKCRTCAFWAVCVCGVCVRINCNCVYWFFCLLLSHNLNPLHFGWHGNWGLTLQDTRRVLDLSGRVWEALSVLWLLTCTLLQYRHTHARHLKAETVLLCLYLAPCLGIPGSAYRIYWHSCLIACSRVHSVRAANPPCTHTHSHTSLSLATEQQTQKDKTLRQKKHKLSLLYTGVSTLVSLVSYF